MEGENAVEQSGAKPIWWTGIVFLCVATAFVHEFGFWKIFHIPILEYVGLTDLPRLAGWSLASLLFSMAVGFGYSAFDVDGMRGRHAPGAAWRTPVGKKLEPFTWFIGLALLILGTLDAFLARPIAAATTAPMLFAFGAYFVINREPKIPRVNVVITGTAVMWGILILGEVYGLGVIEAITIRDGNTYLLATFPGQPSASLRFDT